MDYEARIRHPGSQISSGAEMLKELGYTDICNPYISFDLINDSNFRYLKTCIENESEIPERYNANIIRLRDYQLGGMINDFREMCNCELHRYETAWEEYRKEYNKSMPEEFYEFWVLYDTVTIGEILPKYINLIDPISMNWIDLEYPKVTVDSDGKYHYQIDEPILTSDPTFLYPDKQVEYDNYEPKYNAIANICEELVEEMNEYIPVWMLRVEHINNQLEYSEPENGETEDEYIRRIKWEARRLIRWGSK